MFNFFIRHAGEFLLEQLSKIFQVGFEQFAHRPVVVFGGLMGTTSGVAGGLAATDPKLVPYGAMTATFYTGVGCLLGPSVLFLTVNAIF